MTTLADLSWPRRTARLSLRPATTDDAAACWAYRRRPEVAEWIGSTWPDEGAFTTWFGDPATLAHQLVVELDGRIVGDAMVQVRTPWAQAEVAEQARDVEALLAWNLDPAVQGRGYGTEVAEELLVVAFDELGLRRVVAELFADNGPSRRLAERIGMRPEARNVRDSLHRDRGWIDGMAYALLADEWRSRRTAPPARAVPRLADLSWPRRTARLLIRPATADDAAVVWAYVRRPEVNGWLLEVFDDEAAFTDRFVAQLAFRTVVEADGVVVGHLNIDVGNALAMVDVADEARGVEGELGWCFDPDAGGRGLATEAAADLLAVAFEGLGLRRVWASCFAGNTPSWRLMERIGMRRELASKEEALHRTLGWQDGYLYALLASEWRERHASRRT